MSRFQKILLASAFVAVGFGVARFLGQPILPRDLLGTRVTSLTSQSTLPTRFDFSAPPLDKVNLLPETTPARNAVLNAGGSTSIDAPTLGSSIIQAPLSEHPTEWSSLTGDVASTPPVGPASAIDRNGSPRARLRNEAPRAVGIDPHSPVTIRRAPPVDKDPSPQVQPGSSQTASSTWLAPPLLNTSKQESAPPTAFAVSYSDSQTPTPVNAASAIGWSMDPSSAEPRTHIVTDGDSLEKLAARYLSDPHRGREIYELNRNVLSSPDLLPIGVELRIPERNTSATAMNDRSGFQPNSAATVNSVAQSNQSLGQENSTPTRPASAPQVIIPRAQLSAPVLVQ